MLNNGVWLRWRDGHLREVQVTRVPGSTLPRECGLAYPCLWTEEGIRIEIDESVVPGLLLPVQFHPGGTALKMRGTATGETCSRTAIGARALALL
jgi:hypothetical protein